VTALGKAPLTGTTLKQKIPIWFLPGFFLCLVLSSCGPGIRIAPPFLLVESQGAPLPADLSAAVVRPASLVVPGGRIDPETAGELDKAIVQGLADAARVLVKKVEVVDRVPDRGYDFVVIPANFYRDFDRNRMMTLSMDITLVRLRDGKESGLLIEGVSGPGTRPALAWERGSGRHHLTGAYLKKNDAYGQALNNALFHLVFDFAKKLDRRLDDFR